MALFDIAQLRKDTPSCEHLLHFNNAGAALSPQPVINAIKQHLDLELTLGGYEAQDHAAHKIIEFYSVASDSAFLCEAYTIFNIALPQ